MSLLSSLSLALLILSPSVFAGSQTKDANCSTVHNRLQEGTWAFYSDCDRHTWCTDQGVCALKQCRTDVYPLGYKVDDHLPDLCTGDTFCPDEGSACLPLQPAGQPCQKNRDDQCQYPPNWQDVQDTTGHGLNVKGAVCLDQTCFYANVTAGDKCVVDNTNYVSYDDDNSFVNIVSRGNCIPGYYCDSQSLVCTQTKELAASCASDKECASYNCMASGQCGVSQETPNHYGTYVYVLVAIGILGAIFGTLGSLFYVHRKQRDAEREKRTQYWREQSAFRRNLQQMREAARASIASSPRNPGSGVASNRSSGSFSGHGAPLTGNNHEGGFQQKGSNLRHDYSDDLLDDDFDREMEEDYGRVQDGRF